MKKETIGEVLRFDIVGVISTALHYGIYWVLQHWIEVNVAYTIGYALSLHGELLPDGSFHVP